MDQLQRVRQTGEEKKNQVASDCDAPVASAHRFMGGCTIGNKDYRQLAVRSQWAWLAVRETDADNFVFNSQKSTQLKRVSIYKIFKAIAKKAGLGETLQHPHVLKHTAAMLMVQQGVNAFLIRRHLGHRSFDSTLAYVNPSDG